MQARIYDGSDFIRVSPALIKYIFLEKKAIDLIIETSVMLDTMMTAEMIRFGKVNDEKIDANCIYSVVRGLALLKTRLAEISGKERAGEIIQTIEKLIEDTDES